VPRVDENKTRPKKGRLNQREREGRMQRFVLLAGTIVIVSVIALVGSGYYFTQYRPLHQLIFRVNDREFDMAYYVSAYQFYGTGQEVIELVEQNELIRQAAEKLGISVSDDESKAEAEKRKIPVNNMTTTFIKAELLTNKLLDEYFDGKIPVSTVQREAMAMFLESEKQAKEIKDRLTGGEDFKKLAAQYSLDKTTKDASGYLDWHPNGIFSAMLGTSVFDDAVFKAEIGVLSAPIADVIKSKSLGYWLMKLVDRQDDQAHVLAILAPDEETAKNVRARIAAGEDFMAVAKEVSQLPGAKDGSDLGYIKKGDRGATFDDFAFKPEVAVGTLGQVVRDDQVQTRGGYWLIQVLTEDKDKTLSQVDRSALKNKTYYEWVASLWADKNNKVENFLTDELKQWAKDASTKS
jgi:parvulin-like peptidyl-prolyl isomerase